MLQVVDAIYEKGTFKPLVDVRLPERQKVKIVFVLEGAMPAADDLPAWALAKLAEQMEGAMPAADDLPAWALAKLAEQSPSFAFLADPREDVYSP